jgi:hypothetical protein
MKFKKGDIVLVPFPFTDLSGYKLSAMSKKCMPKIVKRFDSIQDLLERR